MTISSEPQADPAVRLGAARLKRALERSDRTAFMRTAQHLWDQGDRRAIADVMKDPGVSRLACKPWLAEAASSLLLASGESLRTVLFPLACVPRELSERPGKEFASVLNGLAAEGAESVFAADPLVALHEEVAAASPFDWRRTVENAAGDLPPGLARGPLRSDSAKLTLAYVVAVMRVPEGRELPWRLPCPMALREPERWLSEIMDATGARMAFPGASPPVAADCGPLENDVFRVSEAGEESAIRLGVEPEYLHAHFLRSDTRRILVRVSTPEGDAVSDVTLTSRCDEDHVDRVLQGLDALCGVVVEHDGMDTMP